MLTSNQPGRLTLDQVNDMDQVQFVAALGQIFEHSPWVASSAWQASPFDSVAELHAEMVRVTSTAQRDQVLALLNAHPELAGREADRHELTDSSAQEQSGAGLDSLTREQRVELQELNRRYHSAHGFPFILAVAGHDAPSVLEALRIRLARSTDQETAEALAQISVITRRRLELLVTEATTPAG